MYFDVLYSVRNTWTGIGRGMEMLSWSYKLNPTFISFFFVDTTSIGTYCCSQLMEPCFPHDIPKSISLRLNDMALFKISTVKKIRFSWKLLFVLFIFRWSSYRVVNLSTGLSKKSIVYTHTHTQPQTCNILASYTQSSQKGSMQYSAYSDIGLLECN
jgi:hypothetical protein